jgi:S-adenosylmethionine:tRNA ribosyltransferase-isomerase
MQLSDFDYDLPPGLIAQTPAEKRDHSRLLRIQRRSEEITHHHFYDLPTLLKPGDVLVLNNTKVMPLRLFGHKISGGQVEILLIKKQDTRENTEVWEALTRPGLKEGQVVIFGDNELRATALGAKGYTRLVELSASGQKLLELLDKLGELPTPPYIKEFTGDPQRYQTIFAQHAGSAAAPTAGLHFTPEVFSALAERGIEITYVTLHVGLATFLGVKTDNILDHKMHSEHYEITAETAQKVNTAIDEGRRIIPAGTTSLRTLESSVQSNNYKSEKFYIQEESSDTEIFIYPGYKFKIARALITNFHLPKSTLVMLVSAFASAPQTEQPFSTFEENLIGRAYKEAIEKRYRFFSFGDAMLIE